VADGSYDTALLQYAADEPQDLGDTAQPVRRKAPRDDHGIEIRHARVAGRQLRLYRVAMLGRVGRDLGPNQRDLSPRLDQAIVWVPELRVFVKVLGQDSDTLVRDAHFLLLSLLCPQPGTDPPQQSGEHCRLGRQVWHSLLTVAARRRPGHPSPPAPQANTRLPAMGNPTAITPQI